MPNPGSARTAEDFVVLLRQARALSELTYWELEERAAAAGHRLAPAVLVEALGQPTLPGEDLVVALLRACGRGDDEIAEWLAVRDRLAGTPTSAPTTPASAVPGSTRARHTLHPPDRGNTGDADGRRGGGSNRSSRRAPGSLPRRLALTAAVVAAGIGSVAVIVSAVQDGDGAPVYTTGLPPDPSAPAQPSGTAETATAQEATPSAAPPASRPVPPSPQAPAGVLRRGTATLQSGQGIDLDGGGSEPDVVAYGAGDSIRADPSSRHFAPGPAATRQACAAVTTYQKSLQDLTAGTGVCVRTDKGRLAHLTVTGTAPLAFSYVVWS